jgi:cytochrome P450
MMWNKSSIKILQPLVVKISVKGKIFEGTAVGRKYADVKFSIGDKEFRRRFTWVDVSNSINNNTPLTQRMDPEIHRQLNKIWLQEFVKNPERAKWVDKVKTNPRFKHFLENMI